MNYIRNLQNLFGRMIQYSALNTDIGDIINTILLNLFDNAHFY